MKLKNIVDKMNKYDVSTNPIKVCISYNLLEFQVLYCIT